MPNIIKVVQITVDPGVTVNTTRRKGDTSKQILLTVNKSTILDVRTAEAPPPPAQSITVFSASASSVLAGSPVKLSWSVSNATVVRLNGAVVATNMVDFVVTPTADTVYELEADGSAQTVSATVSITVTQPSPLPVESATFVQITDAPADGAGDGPNWQWANGALRLPWVHPGGDWRDKDDAVQGANHYALITAPAPGDFSADVTALVARLLTRNTGMYVNAVSGNAWLASRQNTAAPGPRLHVVTDAGTFDAPCIVDTYLAPSSNASLGDKTGMQFPALLKFDLSGVTGTVQSATLTLAVTYVHAPCTIALDYLDCPAIFIPDLKDGTPGIAATVAKDKDLANHPSVLIYDDIVSAEYVKANFQGIAPSSDATQLAGCPTESIDWPQYGLKALRCWRNPPAQRLISWHHWAEPKQNPPKPWQRDFGDGWEHLFCRYLLEIGLDVNTYMTEQGMKIPGMAGTYNWSTSGGVTLPEPSEDGTWEARLWHTGVSKAHPHVYGTMVYLYAAEHPLSIWSGSGTTENPMRGFLQAGRVVSIEQEIKCNTFTNGVPNHDGIIRVWFDGVLVFERTDVYLRKYENVRIQSVPWVNIYHGGMGVPSGPFHYDIGGIVVAKEYIGPPKLLTSPPPDPEPTPEATIDSFTATPATVAQGGSSTLAWQTSNAKAVTLNDTPVVADGSQVVTPQATTAYTLKADAKQQSVSVAVTIPQPEPPPPDPNLPSFVPPSGTFAEFTLNTPADVKVDGVPQFYYAIFANWVGAAFINDYSPKGGVAYHGGGEHYSWNDRGGVLMLNCDTRMYEARCVPTNTGHMGAAVDASGASSGGPTDDFGCYVDDGYPQLKHTYLGLVEFPKAWGGGPNGSLIRIQSGGVMTSPIKDADGKITRLHGRTAAHAFDLSQARDGYRRLTGDQLYDFGNGLGAAINDAPCCGTDGLRKGWWTYPRAGTGWGDQLCFTSSDGQITNKVTPPLGAAWGTIHHFADDDSLVVIAGQPNKIAISHPGQAWQDVTVTGSAADVAGLNFLYWGYAGFKWSVILQCFVALDYYVQPDGNLSKVRVYRIIPSAQRYTTPWTVQSEVLTSADGSTLDLKQQQSASLNGSFGKLVECPALRSFVWTRRVDSKGQLLRLQGM